MSVIPLSHFVGVTPGVISAGGAALAMNGMALTNSTRVPIGQALSFPSETAVGAFFGLASHEFAFSEVYFEGFDNSNIKPGALWFWQFNQAPVAAYLRGGVISGLTESQWQAITGSLSIVMDGDTYTYSSVNLASATSLSAVATALQTGLNASLPAEASVTASIGAAFTATGTGTSLAVTAVTGILSPGDVITGTGVPVGTTIVSGPPAGGAGTYITSGATTAVAASCMSTSNVLNVTVVASGTVAVGQTISAVSGLTAAQITALGTGTGATGTYVFGGAQQSKTSGTITCTGSPLAVAFDSVSGALTVTSGDAGPQSTAAFATGSAAAALFLTSATGAVLSQGAAASTPAAAMQAILGFTQNWVSFTTTFDPDAIGSTGNTMKKAFAAWNATQNNRWLYVAWDNDITPTESTNAASSLGQYLLTSKASGTAPIYEPTDLFLGAYLMGQIASIDYTEQDGSVNSAFKSQSGLLPSVSNGTVAANLEANSYNYYGITSVVSATDSCFYPGTVSGQFNFIEPYVNQINLNVSLQISIYQGLRAFKSVPYNQAGADIIKAFCLGPIGNALNFGSIITGVTLSPTQIAELKSEAGLDISGSLFSQGYYLQVLQATPAVRAEGGSPPCTLWYQSRNGVNKINLASIGVQ